ncbi:MAG: phosphoenolpyruvate--protein phosphotransferase [Balneola sp.]
MSSKNVIKRKIFQGISASSGIAIGNVVCLENKRRKVLPQSILESEIEEHLNYFKDSREILIEELSEMLSYLDADSAAIIETQKQILLDAEVEKRVHKIVSEELLSSDYAVYRTFCDFIERLKESGSELFRQRIVDLENLRDRFIDTICEDGSDLSIKKGTILVTKEISPTELVSFHEKGLSGLVMEKGGITSHAALIAQSLEIPCIVSMKNATSKILSGKAILDGREGQLILDPEDELLSEYKSKLKKLKRAQKRLLKNISEPSETKSGTSFSLHANIEFKSELGQLKKYNANDIGLLRTEGLLFSNNLSFEEQAEFYETVLASVSGKVTFRLFDVGGDKLNTKLPEESNPFLGWRGIRMLLDEKELLNQQLRALLICAGKNKGRVKILVPMISVEEEIIRLKTLINDLQAELKAKGKEVDPEIELGIMIEVPSAALNAEHLAKHIDFMSIGTNDLTQYTLAVDRGNERICSLYQQQHPSIWSLIKITADAAKKTKTELAVCGELAGDVLGACGLVGLGITNLSMISNAIPRVKEELISHEDDEFESLADSFLKASNTTQIKGIFEDWRNH